MAASSSASKGAAATKATPRPVGRIIGAPVSRR
jgi:hypothetical protein